VFSLGLADWGSWAVDGSGGGRETKLPPIVLRPIKVTIRIKFIGKTIRTAKATLDKSIKKCNLYKVMIDTILRFCQELFLWQYFSEAFDNAQISYDAQGGADLQRTIENAFSCKCVV
jgi:hypothetical protein